VIAPGDRHQRRMWQAGYFTRLILAWKQTQVQIHVPELRIVSTWEPNAGHTSDIAFLVAKDIGAYHIDW